MDKPAGINERSKRPRACVEREVDAQHVDARAHANAERSRFDVLVDDLLHQSFGNAVARAMRGT